tara:strand:+ start:1287 stop:2732 length:1446 start_codon:yes stop_codon:yes gene_type:complete
MSKKFSLVIIIIIIIFGLSYYFVNSVIGGQKLDMTKLPFTLEQRQFIKKYLFPHKYYSQKNKTISQQKEQIKSLNFTQIEYDFKNSYADIYLQPLEDFALSNKKILKRYKIKNGFYTAIFGLRPGGYIDFHNNNLFVLSSRGILGFSENMADSLKIKQIKNNIYEFIGLEQFEKKEKSGKNYSFAIRDLFIHKNKIYISYTDEIKKDCWNTSVIYGDINYKNIKFQKLKFNEKCIKSDVNSPLNIDGEFNNGSSGGRIQSFDDDHILLTVGCYLSRYLAQDKNSINGKVLKININNSNYEIVSMGHRNPQGLFFDKENNIIIESEHGPMGGDEVNLIDIKMINEDKPLNYGWAISSAGEHYGGRVEKNIKKYKKYPLYKSHSEHGFIEPLKSFVPSIGISEVSKVREKNYVVASMGYDRPGDKSLYFFDLDDQNKLKNLKQVQIYERIRDLKIHNNKIYLLLEGPHTAFKWSPSIGVISLN